MLTANIKTKWFGNIRGDVLAGLTATLALIPDSLAFSFIAGVNPMVGIYSSICILLVISFTGGRPAMISAAAGSMSVLMITLVSKHGIEYLFAATILTGILQYLMGVLKLGRLMKFVPHAVLIGFVNALAILIFLAQLKNFSGESWPMYLMVAGTLAIIYVLPRFFKAVPSPLIAVAVMTIAAVVWGIHTKSVGDIADMTPVMPSFLLPHVPFSLATLAIILPYSLSLAVVGYAETLLTQDIIDEMTATKTNKNREMKGQGIANILTGFFGGMAGCALIAESAINVKMGGRSRLSTLSAAVFLLLLVVVFGEALSYVPMAALAGVMLMVCFELFDWSYIGRLHKIPRSEAFIMLATVGIVVYTHDLAIGVLCGVVMSAVVFAYKASRISIDVNRTKKGTEYRVSGQLFFGSTSELYDKIEFQDPSPEVYIDLTRAHVWDHAAEVTLAKIRDRLEQNGAKVRLVGR